MSSDGVRKELENRLWKAALNVSRAPEHRLDLTVKQYPDWRLRCHQSQQWFLWHLYDEAQAESPDPAGHFALVTVDRRDDSELATFQLSLLEAWLAGEQPFVIPRRKRRVGFAHHSMLAEIDAPVPMLVSAESQRPLLVSVRLSDLKRWMTDFPAKDQKRAVDEQIELSLWGNANDSTQNPNMS